MMQKIQLASPIWVPVVLWEWLILVLNVGHGFDNAQWWIRDHSDDFSNEEPSEYIML